MMASWRWEVWSERLGWSLWHSLWQFLLVAGVVAILRAVLGSRRPAARYAVGVAGLAAFVLLPLATMATVESQPRSPAADSGAAFPNAEATGVERSVISAAATGLPADAAGANASVPGIAVDESAARGSLEVGRTWSGWRDWPRAGHAFWRSCCQRIADYLSWVACGWCVGVMLFSLRPLASWWEIRQLRRAAIATVPAPLVELLDPLCSGLRIARKVGLALTERSEVPLVIGWLQPLILLPASMATGLTVTEWRAVLAHELAHVRRHDYLVNLAQVAVETLFFYHPAVWWLSRRVREDREEACDDLAIAVLGDRGGYGRALLAVEQLRHQPELLSLSVRGGSLLARVRRLLGRDKSPPPWVLGCSLLGVAVVVSLALVLAPHVNAVADEPNPTEPVAANQSDPTQGSEPDAIAWTPARLAEGIAEIRRRIENVEYTATFTETRNANAFSNKAPLLVSGDGEVHYRSDGRRWWVDEKSFSLNVGEAGKIPRRSFAFFDGQNYVVAEDEQFRIGENSLANHRWNASSVLWGNSWPSRWSDMRQVPREELISGIKTVVVTAESRTTKSPDGDESNWRTEVAIAPSHSFLPLRTLRYFNGRLQSETRLSGLTQSAEGVWYPRRIEVRNFGAGEALLQRGLTIRQFRLHPAWVQPPMVPPFGYDVVDYRVGRAWHQDPWWDELQPWLRDRFQWPRPGVRSQSMQASHVKEEMEGVPAPTIAVQEWVQGEFQGWDRPDRRVTMVVFFGGDAISPTPEWISQTRVWLDKYQPFGLEVVGIATSSTSHQTLVDTIQSLAIPFPIARDAMGDDSQPHGRTHAACGLRSYAGIVLVDQHGKLRLFGDAGPERKDLETRIRELLLAAQPGITLPPPSRDEELSNDEVKQIEVEWLRRLESEPGRSRISGIVTAGDGKRVTGAKLEVMPVLKLLHSQTLGGYVALPARKRKIEVITGAVGQYSLEGIRHGSYQVVCSADGLARVARIVHLGAEGDAVALDFELTQGDALQGVVVDVSGQPVPKAKVRITNRHPDPETPRRHTTEHMPNTVQQTDPQGQFAWRGVYQGAYSLEVTAPGYDTRKVPVVPAGTKDLRVTLQKPGEPVAPPARLRETPASRTRRVRSLLADEKWSELHAFFAPDLAQELTIDRLRTEWQTLVQVGGKFKRFRTSQSHDSDPHWLDESLHWENLQLTLSLLWNDAGQLVGWDWNHPSIDGSHGPELARRLQAKGSVRVSVKEVDAETMKQLTAELWQEVPLEADGDGEWPGDGGNQWVCCRLASNGPGLQFERLVPGRYRAVVREHSATGGRGGISSVFELTAASGTVECPVELSPGTDVVLRLLRQSDGSPLPDARVTLTRISTDGPRRDYPLVRHQSPAAAEWRYEHLPPGRYRVVAWQRADSPDAPVFETAVEDAIFELGSGRDEFRRDIRLQERPQTAAEIQQVWPWVVEGTVRDDQGQPLAEVELRASSGMGTLRNSGTTRTDAQGRYRLRIGPGVWIAHDSPDPFDAQVAVVFCSKPGLAEVNLGRHADFLAVNRLPRPGEQTLAEGREDRLLVAGEPRRLDFVLTPAAEIVAKFRDEHDQPLIKYDIDLHGDELPPAGSVLKSLDSDERGQVVLRDVPVGFAWWLSADTRSPDRSDRSARFRLPRPGRYEMLLQRRIDEQSKLHWLEVVSLVNAAGKDVIAESLVPDPGVGAPLPVERQREVRALLQRVAVANGVWLQGPLPHVGTFAYQFERIGKPTQRLVVDPRHERRWPDVVGTAYRSALLSLTAAPDNFVFRRFDVRDGVAVVDYVVKPGGTVMRYEHGLGVAGSYGPYVSSSVREGTVAIDMATATPLWLVAGERREEFSDYEVARDGSRVPRELRIYVHERLEHDWRFALIDSGLWLLREARDAEGKVVVRINVEKPGNAATGNERR